MTKTLILMRHAKSSWNAPAMRDHARPLNTRGQRSARALGDWLRTQGWTADEALSSSSQRTRETFAGLDIDAPARFTNDLYHAGPEQIRQVLAQASGEMVLILGHNPGIAEFAEELVQSPPDHERFLDYPTGATLVVRFEIERWDQIQPATGQVLDFIVPRVLMTG